MGALFIIGNGFDLAHNMPTSYRDFRRYILEMYPQIIPNRDLQIELDDYLKMNEEQLLVYAMDHASGDTWSDFEDALSRINFMDKIPKRIHKENETEEEDHLGAPEYLFYAGTLAGYFAQATRLWSDFFRRWIKEVEKKIERNEYSPRHTISGLMNEPDMQFFSFNYTKTPQVLYNVRKVIHIHNRTGQNLVFGHGVKNVTYQEPARDGCFGSSDLDDMLMSFKKDTQRQIKKYSDFFKRLDVTVDRVYSYGFSYSSVDSIYIKMIVQKIAPDACWYFTEFEAQNQEELRRRKIKLRRYGFKGIFATFDG